MSKYLKCCWGNTMAIYSHTATFTGITYSFLTMKLKTHLIHTAFTPLLLLINLNNLIVMRKRMPRGLKVLFQVLHEAQERPIPRLLPFVPHHPTPPLHCQPASSGSLSCLGWGGTAGVLWIKHPS